MKFAICRSHSIDNIYQTRQGFVTIDIHLHTIFCSQMIIKNLYVNADYPIIWRRYDSSLFKDTWKKSKPNMNFAFVRIIFVNIYLLFKNGRTVVASGKIENRLHLKWNGASSCNVFLQDWKAAANLTLFISYKFSEMLDSISCLFWVKLPVSCQLVFNNIKHVDACLSFCWLWFVLTSLFFHSVWVYFYYIFIFSRLLKYLIHCHQKTNMQ